MKKDRFELNEMELDEEKVPNWMKSLVYIGWGMGFVILVISVLARSFKIFSNYGQI